jgi:hypothetical protein
VVELRPFFPDTLAARCRPPAASRRAHRTTPPPPPTRRRLPSLSHQALAQALAPCVAWLPPAPKPARAGGRASNGDDAAGGGGGGSVASGASDDGARGPVHLEGEELQAVVAVLEGMINRFANIFG